MFQGLLSHKIFYFDTFVILYPLKNFDIDRVVKGENEYSDITISVRDIVVQVCGLHHIFRKLKQDE